MGQGEIVYHHKGVYQKSLLKGLANRDIIHMMPISTSEALVLVTSKTYLKGREVFLSNLVNESSVSLSASLNLEGVPAYLEYSKKLDASWISTDGNGVYQVMRNLFLHFGKKVGITQNFIYEITEDFDQNIVLLSKGGVYVKGKDDWAFQEISGFENVRKPFHAKNTNTREFLISAGEYRRSYNLYESKGKFKINPVEYSIYKGMVNYKKGAISANGDAIRYVSQWDGKLDSDTLARFFQQNSRGEKSVIHFSGR